jgi:hypothetical protein
MGHNLLPEKLRLEAKSHQTKIRDSSIANEADIGARPRYMCGRQVGGQMGRPV